MTRARLRWWPVLALAVGVAFTYRFLAQGQLQAARDLFRLFIPESAYLRERLLAGEIALWNPYSRLGQPFLGTLYTQVLYPPRLFFVGLFGAAWGINLQIAFHAALASTGAFLASRRLGSPRWAALIAGLFGLTPMFNRLGQAQHVASSAAWSGFILLGALAVARRPSWQRAGLIALPLGLSFLCGAPEMVVWQSVMVLAVLLSARAPKRVLPYLGLGLGWALVLGAAIAIPAAELIATWRGPTDTLVDRYEWSASFPQLLSMGWLFADEKRALYWAQDQWFVTSLFIGAVPCALAAVGLRRGGRRQWPLLVVALLCATLALGSHFFLGRWLLLLPPLSFFRYPTKYAVGLAFCIAMLAPFGARRVAVWARRVEPTVKRLGLSLVGSFVAIGVAVAVARLPYWREGIATGVFCFGVACLTMVAAFMLVRPGVARGRRVGVALAGIAIVECVLGQQLVPATGTISASWLEHPSSLATAMRADGVERVSVWHAEGELPGPRGQSTLAPAEEANSFVVDSRDNLVPLRWMEERLEVVEGYGFRDPERLKQVFDEDPRGPYDVFGVTHYVRSDGQPYSDTPELASSSRAAVYRATTAFPRAWVVTQSRVVDDAIALKALREEPASLRQTAFLSDGPTLGGADCASTATVVTRHPERVVVRAEACAAGLLVLSDAWFPGWKARVDGVEAPIHRTDFVLRAVEVPAGTHEVVFEYAPRSFSVGSGATALGCLALLIAAVRRRNVVSA